LAGNHVGVVTPTLAYRLKDADHLTAFDAFDLLMIEQRFGTTISITTRCCKSGSYAICLDEFHPQPARCAGGIEMESCRIININLAAWAVSARPSPCTMRRLSEHSGLVWRNVGVGRGRSHNIAALDSGKLHTAGDVSGLGALLGREHHRAGSDGFIGGARLSFPTRRVADMKCAQS